MNKYPFLQEETLPEVVKVIKEMVRERENDVSDFDNIASRFMKGRKVGKVPTASADVAATDREGDFNYSDMFLYIAVLSGGSLVWRRITLSSW